MLFFMKAIFWIFPLINLSTSVSATSGRNLSLYSGCFSSKAMFRTQCRTFLIPKLDVLCTFWDFKIEIERQHLCVLFLALEHILPCFDVNKIALIAVLPSFDRPV